MKWVSPLTLFIGVLSAVAIGRLVPSAIGKGAANLGELELSRHLLTAEASVDLGVPMPDLAENWMRVALRFDPQSQSTRALQFEIAVLKVRPGIVQAFGQAVQWQRIGQQGQFVFESGRPVNRHVQYELAFALAENAYQGEDWTEAIKWYWRAFAITPGELPDLVRNHYYQALGHVYLNDAKDTGVGHSYILASKAFWMANRLNEAQVFADGNGDGLSLTGIDKAWVAFIRGQWAESQGDRVQAERLYYSSQSNTEGFPYSLLALRSWIPDILGQNIQKWKWTKGQALLPPFEDVNLVGYILDEDIIGMGLDVPILTLWTLPRGVKFGELEAGSYFPMSEDHWIGYSVQRNLVRNSGFEWYDVDRPGKDGVLGWFKIGATMCGCSVLSDPWGVRPGSVGRFTSEIDGTQVIYLASRPLAVDKGTNYMGGGWMRAETNDREHWVGGWMGAWWDTQIEWFMSVAERQWTQQSKILKAPDSSHVISLGIWVIPVYPVSGVIYADNIFVIELPHFARE